MKWLDQVVAGVTGNERALDLVDPYWERLNGRSLSLRSPRPTARRGADGRNDVVGLPATQIEPQV